MHSIGDLIQPFPFQEFKSQLNRVQYTPVPFIPDEDTIYLGSKVEVDGREEMVNGYMNTVFHPYTLFRPRKRLVILVFLNLDLKCLEVKTEDYDIIII